ncbi:MAG TPA: ABC transporter substrate-binding protein, partial [Spirochaetota bacterium]|nr:ABC transporter substrate-binding protein [Spirochaetota bacterium]
TVLLLFLACSREGANGDIITITYSHSVDPTGATAALIKAFEKKHPHIKVKFLEKPSDTGMQHDFYVTAFNGKSDEIDVLDIDVIWPPEFSQAGYLLPLNRFIAKDDFDISIYNQGALDAAAFRGKIWAIPKFIDAGLLFYRKDIVKKPPRSWDELIKMGRKYQQRPDIKYGYLMQAKQYEGLVCNAVEFVASYGGGFINGKGEIIIDSKESIKGLQKLVEIATSDIVPANINNFTEVESHTAYIQGQAVFIRNWPYQYALANNKRQSKIAGKTGVAPLPAGDAGSAAALGGWLCAINKYSRHPLAAWEFLQFVTGMQGQKISALKSSSPPTIPALFKDKDILQANPFFAEKGLQHGLSAAVARPKAANYQEISDIIQIHLSKAISGEETAAEAVDKMARQMKKAMRR